MFSVVDSDIEAASYKTKLEMVSKPYDDCKLCDYPNA